jgi:hypothetical protein
MEKDGRLSLIIYEETLVIWWGILFKVFWRRHEGSIMQHNKNKLRLFLKICQGIGFF